MSKDKRLYTIWKSMKQRCYNPNNRYYKDYGGRGITMCNEWLLSYYAFETWAFLNGYKENLSIDRIDVNKGYAPNNCRWVSWIVQNNNTRKNKYITYKGKTQSMADWCRELNLNYYAVRGRFRKGWTVEKAFTTKIRDKVASK